MGRNLRCKLYIDPGSVERVYAPRRSSSCLAESSPSRTSITLATSERTLKLLSAEAYSVLCSSEEVCGAQYSRNSGCSHHSNPRVGAWDHPSIVALQRCSIGGRVADSGRV